MDRIYREVGTRIRAERLRRGLTLEDLGDLCGMHPSYLGQIERCAKKASLSAIAVVAKGLGVAVSTLFSPDGDGRKDADGEQMRAVLRSHDGREKALLVSTIRHLSKALKTLK